MTQVDLYIGRRIGDFLDSTPNSAMTANRVHHEVSKYVKELKVTSIRSIYSFIYELEIAELQFIYATLRDKDMDIPPCGLPRIDFTFKHDTSGVYYSLHFKG